MNILFVCHRFPYPPKRGGKIRPFNIIRHLSQNHAVTVASLVRSAAEAEEGKGIAPHCKKYVMERITETAARARMMFLLPTRVPSSMGNFYSPSLARRVHEEIDKENFDLIIVHCSSAAQYVEHVRDVPKILDFGDMDSQKWLMYARTRPFPLSLGYWLEGAKLQRAEIDLARKFDLCTCTTRAELNTLRSYNVETCTGWFANGVDLEYFTPTNNPYQPHSLCFIGRMDYFPNQECVLQLCLQTLPLIRERCPDVTFTIVGAAPPPRIRKLAQLPGVTVTGTVPDVRPYVRQSAATVATLSIARGTQNKILESMAMGVPVIASEAAATGIDAVPGEHLLVGSGPCQYANAALRLLLSSDERRHFSEAARSRVETHHDWTRTIKDFERLVSQRFPMAYRDSEPRRLRVKQSPSPDRGHQVSL